MSHYEERLEKDLAAIRSSLEDVAAKVEEAVRSAVHALLTRNDPQAYQVILGDHAINRAIRAIDARCHAFVARHLPSAGHLRFVSSVLRLTVALERIGDYAVSIARESVQLSEAPPAALARDIELMSEQGRQVLRQAMQAFTQGNAEAARGTAGAAAQAGKVFRKVFSDLLAEESEPHRLRDLFALLIVCHRLERVSDQAKNICEETLFTVLGETKSPKVYQVLFVDERDDRASQLAVAFARKAFPGSGRFASAGWSPAADLAAELPAFLERHGLDPGELRPRLLEPIHEVLAPYHVIVGLGGDPRPRLGAIPYHVVVLAWDLGGADAELDGLLERLATRIRDLMETLRGPDAS